jgi:hypothetical protein
MKWRVWEQKLLLAKAIMEQEEEVLARQVLVDQVALGLPGLAKEVQEICQIVGLPNICHIGVTKEDIKEMISMNHMKCLKEELQQLEVKGAELLKVDLRSPQSYFLTSSLPTARMAFRIQNRMLDIPADMPGRYIGRMQCSGCLGWEQEQKEQEQKEQEQGEKENEPPLMTRERIEECPGFAFLRADKEMIDPKEQSEFFIAVMKFRSMR